MLRQLDILIGLATVLSLVSLLIMVLNQMIVSGFQLRGKNLQDALEVMFKTLKPDLGDKASQLAEVVLRHPAISDSAKSGDKRALASAIRPSELVETLEMIAAVDHTSPQAAWICGNRFSGGGILEHTIGIAARVFQAGGSRTRHAGQPVDVESVQKTAKDVLGLLSEPHAAPAHASQISGAAAPVPAVQNADYWLTAVEDRAREWFATRAQQWNVVLAILLVFGLQLDVISLYHKLTHDDAFRARMVEISASVVAQADNVAGRAKDTVERVHKAAVQTLKADSAINGIIGTALDERPPAVVTSAQVASWIAHALSGKTPPEIDQATKAYSTAAEKTAGVEFVAWQKSLEDLKAKIDQTSEGSGFQIIPSNYPDSFGEWLGYHTRTSSGLITDATHLAGMLIFILLLSLGAPWWFNILKTLTSFRPLLAQRVDKDPRKPVLR